MMSSLKKQTETPFIRYSLFRLFCLTAFVAVILGGMLLFADWLNPLSGRKFNQADWV
jgi:hypothetical protein